MSTPIANTVAKAIIIVVLLAVFSTEGVALILYVSSVKLGKRDVKFNILSVKWDKHKWNAYSFFLLLSLFRNDTASVVHPSTCNTIDM